MNPLLSYIIMMKLPRMMAQAMLGFPDKPEKPEKPAD